MTGALCRPLRLLVVPLGLALAACAQVVNPATGEREYTTLTPAQEQQIGQQEHPKILQQFGGAYPDPALQAYVTEIGEKMKGVSELANQEFTFTLLNTDTVNAFALPGGYVYVTRGLLALAENEAELAGVIGHEIGHVTGRHTAQRQTQATVAGGLGTLGVLGAAILGGGAAAELAQQAVQVGGQAYLAGYSRDQELEADELGIRYLQRAGYDPRSMATFLAKLNEQSELDRQLAGVQGDPAASWFATHPRTLDRVEAALREEGVTAGGELNRGAYLQKIGGMIYGEDPTQGFVRGSRFIHPQLGVAFEAPQRYQLENTPQAVVGQAQGGAFKFDLVQVAAGADLRDYVGQTWARELGAQRIEGVQGFEVNGMRGARAATRAQSQSGPVVVRLAAIRADGRNVYRFMFIDQGQGTAAFQQTVDSFHRLSASEAAEFGPRRIVLAPVRAGDTSNSFARRMAVERAPAEQFQILNALALEDGLRAGEQVKLIAE
jgi:predicted Zn-dependent protease